MGFLTNKSLDELEEEDEYLSKKISVLEKKRLIKEAKKKWGKDWKDRVPLLGNIFKGKRGTKSGINWNALKFNLK